MQQYRKREIPIIAISLLVGALVSLAFLGIYLYGLNMVGAI